MMFQRFDPDYLARSGSIFTRETCRAKASVDFETKLFARTNLEEILRGELADRSYVCKPINIGRNTDPYQSIEKKWRLTRAALALLNQCNPFFGTTFVGSRSVAPSVSVGLVSPVATPNAPPTPPIDEGKIPKE